MNIWTRSIVELALLINKKNSEAVKKIDEVYREDEEIDREFGVLIEDLNKIEIIET